MTKTAPAVAALAVAILSLTACAGMPRGTMPSTSAPGSTRGSRDSLPEGPGIGAPGASGYDAPEARSLMVDTALGMLGQPYKYGGAAPGGFDCSGLVVYAAAGAGIHLPRTASEQRQLGASVSRSHLKAGDLIFMHLASKELHVGIALDGARFIHAPSSGGRVRIDSLAAEPYAAGFIGARRVIADR